MISPTRTRVARRILVCGALGAIACGAAFSVALRARAAYWSAASPDTAGLRSGVLGPPARDIVRRARMELRNLLADGGAGGSYVSRLHGIEDWYRQAALASPLDGASVLGLATVACENDILAEGAPGKRCEGLLLAAGGRERFNAAHQLRVAKIYLRIGSVPRGSEIAARAVGLDASASDDAFHMLQEFGVDADAAVAALGAGPLVILAARESYVSAGRTDDYLTLLESGLDAASRPILDMYREVAFRAKAFDRVLDRLSTARTNPDGATEATRLRILAEAQLATGHGSEASAEIRAALALAGDDPLVLEVGGDCDVMQARVADGQRKYREALGVVARGGASAGQMGRLYLKIGECWEALGDGARAFDSYRKSLELAPDDPTSAARLRTITHRDRMMP